MCCAFFLYSTDSPGSFVKSSCCVGRGHKRQYRPRAVQTIGQGQTWRTITVLTWLHNLVRIYSFTSLQWYALQTCKYYGYIGPYLNFMICWERWCHVLSYTDANTSARIAVYVFRIEKYVGREMLVQLLRKRSPEAIGFLTAPLILTNSME
jgi:hypothetical protein